MPSHLRIRHQFQGTTKVLSHLTAEHYGLPTLLQVVNVPNEILPHVNTSTVNTVMAREVITETK